MQCCSIVLFDFCHFCYRWCCCMMQFIDVIVTFISIDCDLKNGFALKCMATFWSKHTLYTIRIFFDTTKSSRMQTLLTFFLPLDLYSCCCRLPFKVLMAVDCVLFFVLPSNINSDVTFCTLPWTTTMKRYTHTHIFTSLKRVDSHSFVCLFVQFYCIVCQYDATMLYNTFKMSYNSCSAAKWTQLSNEKENRRKNDRFPFYLLLRATVCLLFLFFMQYWIVIVTSLCYMIETVTVIYRQKVIRPTNSNQN